jgi:hypothetical protein
VLTPSTERTTSSYQAGMATVSVVGLMVAVETAIALIAHFLQVSIVFHIYPAHISNQRLTPFIRLSDVVLP